MPGGGSDPCLVLDAQPSQLLLLTVRTGRWVCEFSCCLVVAFSACLFVVMSVNFFMGMLPIKILVHSVACVLSIL